MLATRILKQPDIATIGQVLEVVEVILYSSFEIALTRFYDDSLLEFDY